jgi:UDP-N-acetylglucosamine/UDP-N-acetylgalactosamine diphosphorylase
VRQDFFCQNKYGGALYDGAYNVLDKAVHERIKQLRLFVQNLDKSMINAKKIFSVSISNKQKQFVQNWPRIEAYLSDNHEEKISLKEKEAFIKIIKRQSDKTGSYLDLIRALTPEQAQKGTGWLNDIVEKTTAECLNASRALQQKDK